VVDHRAAVIVLAAVVALGACAWLVPAGAAAELKCATVTIPVKVTGTVPVTYIDTTATGVSCRYTEKVFLPDISKMGAAPPAGWSIRVDSAGRGVIEDTCTRGKEVITFRLARTS